MAAGESGDFVFRVNYDFERNLISAEKRKYTGRIIDSSSGECRIDVSNEHSGPVIARIPALCFNVQGDRRIETSVLVGELPEAAGFYVQFKTPDTMKGVSWIVLGAWYHQSVSSH